MIESAMTEPAMMIAPLKFPPGLILMLGALMLPFLKDRIRLSWILILPVLTLLAVWWLPAGNNLSIEYLNFTLHPVNSTATGRLFATVFCIMVFTGGLYAMNQSRVSELIAAYVYAGGAIAVTFAGDLISLFVFWEIMAVASTLVIWTAGTQSAHRAGMRYLMVHLLGGVILMIGIAAHVIETGSIAFGAMQLHSAGTWLILIGFLINVGAPPLSAWIADAYPEASPGGMVFLSAFTTKTAVYALLVGFPGTTLLIYIGVYMMFYGIIYALLENDMRRILAYSIVNQVGFMVTGIGVGTHMSLNGAAAHAFADIIFKSLMLMSAGSVLTMTGKRKCTDLGGLFRTMPVTMWCGIIGALAISAFPLTSSFVSKSMTIQAAADQHLTFVWFMLVAASAGVFLHAGIKFPWFVFFQKDSGLRPPDPPLNMRIAMYLFAFLCLAIGVFPQALYAILPFPVEFIPYTTEHVVTQLQLLLFAGLAFFIMLPMMKRTLTLSLDFDWVYRKLGTFLSLRITHHTSTARNQLESSGQRQIKRFVESLFKHHGPHGILARTWPTGSMVLWVAVLLGVYLIFYYI